MDLTIGFVCLLERLSLQMPTVRMLKQTSFPRCNHCSPLYPVRGELNNGAHFYVQLSM